jgi:NAD(P)-dependent dehydrogenase (short-subunit alcohol dehydrogenase family)
MNHIAMVTGASRGLGRALSAGLAREGYDLILDARDGPALAAAAHAFDSRVTAIAGDVTDPAHRAALARAAEAAGGLDLLVNNAGTLGASPPPALADYPAAALRAAFEVNVIAPLALTQLMLPMLRARGGAVLNVTSDAAVEPRPRWSRPPTCWPPRSWACGCGGPTRATCAPTCTRRRSRARTSPTGRSRRRWSRRCCGSSPAGCRAAGTGPRT